MPTNTPTTKYSPVLTHRILSRNSVLFPFSGEYKSSPENPRTHTLLRNSGIIADDIHNVRFIYCKKAYKLAEMAKQYTWHTVLRRKLFVDLANSIILNDREVIEQLPQTLVDDIREWIRFFQQTDIPKEFLKHTVIGPSVEFRIVNTEIYNDNVCKTFVPFTNLYKLTKYENCIETMMKEITEAVYGKPIYVSIMMPLGKNDIPTDEDKIARDIL